MRFKILVLLTVLMLMIGVANAQEETIVLPPSTSQSLILQRAIQGEWQGNDTEGTLTLISQNPLTQVVVKYPQMTGGVYDTAQFNSVWAEYGAEVEAVLDTETYNARLMLSAPVTDGDVVEYEARVIEFLDYASEERELGKTFESVRLVLLPTPEFVSAVAGIAMEVVAPDEEGMVFVSHVYFQVGTQANYDADAGILTITGLNSGVFRVSEVVSSLRGETLFTNWSLVPDVAEARYSGMLAYADGSIPFLMSAPTYDADTESLSVSLSLAEGVVLPEQVELPTLVIMTDMALQDALQAVLTQQTSGIRNDACAQATATFDALVKEHQMASTASTIDLNGNNIGQVNITEYGVERLSQKIAAASAYKDQVCGASTPPAEFP